MSSINYEFEGGGDTYKSIIKNNSLSNEIKYLTKSKLNRTFYNKNIDYEQIILFFIIIFLFIGCLNNKKSYNISLKEDILYDFKTPSLYLYKIDNYLMNILIERANFVTRFTFFERDFNL